MPITGHFEADFSQFNDGVKDATATLKDFEKDSTTAGKAIDQLGKDAPAAINQIAKETKGASTSMIDMSGVAKQLAGVMAGAFSVNAILNFAQSVLDTADAIGKLSAQTGMTYAEVQRLQYISGQTGSSMASLSGAAQTLRADLGNDDKGVVGALRHLNINLEDFKDLGAYSQMTQLSTAISGLKNPYDQATTAEALFHKQWKEIFPAMKTDMAALGKQAWVMGDDMVDNMRRTKDEWAATKQAMTFVGGEIIGIMHAVADEVKKGTAGPGGIGGTFDAYVVAISKAIADLRAKLGGGESGLGGAIAAIPPLLKPVVTGFQAIALSAADAKVQEDSWTASIKERIAQEKTEQDFLAAQKIHYEAVATLQDQIFGKPALDKAVVWSDAMLGLSDDVGKLSADMRVDLQNALVAAQGEMQKLGLLNSDLSVRYSTLISAVDTFNGSMTRTAEVVLPAVSGAVTDYTQKLYDEAVAQDAVAAAAARANAARAGEMAAATGGGGGSGKIGYLPPRGSEGYVAMSGGSTSGSGAGSSYYTPPRRAAGGPVTAGQPYVVGEKGPELFVPGASGAIAPGGGAVVYNTFNLVDTESNLARRVSDTILRTITSARRM
jgi:hypothetical protein